MLVTAPTANSPNGSRVGVASPYCGDPTDTAASPAELRAVVDGVSVLAVSPAGANAPHGGEGGHSPCAAVGHATPLAVGGGGGGAGGGGVVASPAVVGPASPDPS